MKPRPPEFMPINFEEMLDEFAAEYDFKGKGPGPLCVALVVTDHARKLGLPLDPNDLVTPSGGQVLGLSKSSVQSILKRHDIDKVLAQEGGRTSRGSLKNMRTYVGFLNGIHDQGAKDPQHGAPPIAMIEKYWIDRVKAFFSGKPFRVRFDSAHSLRRLVRDLLDQARSRQKESTGTSYVGAVMQHLVGAKFDCVLESGTVEHHSFSTADAPAGRAGDFLLGDVAVHVTTAPGESVIERCRENLDGGRKPVLITVPERIATAEGLAADRGLDDRIDIFEIEQFIALNLYEIGKFRAEGRRESVDDLVRRYNQIVDIVETDPSLMIELI